MGKGVHRLSTVQAKAFEKGKYADGNGLWLVKRDKKCGKWILRYTVKGTRREMGLGAWPDVAIAEARARASKYRQQIRDGVDPIAERQKERLKVTKTSLEEIVLSCFEARQAELKGDGKAGRWLSPLSLHILPKIGNIPVEELDQHMIKKALEPIWHDKADTSKKALGRLNLSLQHAAALGLDVDLQAGMKARALLGKQRHKAQHIPSLPYTELPAFYAWLSTQPHSSCLALRFLILTACRTSEVRFASREELKDDLWIIPKERTKTGNEHRVPLVNEALTILERCPPDGLLFPSPTGKAMSDATMSRFMERHGYTARPHGFRASFRTWVEEQTETEFEVKEAALGHKVDLGIVGAYQRSDRLEKRRVLMSNWASYVCQSVDLETKSKPVEVV